LFLTALADKVSPEWVTIHVSHMPNEPNLLGYESVGNIIVNGDVGRNTGLRSKGSMIINGNVKGDIASEFQGVSIHVKGDAESAAREMKKGRVTIDGNTKHAVADGMTGGTLILNGDISKLSKEIWGGKIIRRGVMLVYKGERRDVKKTIYEDYE
jgi:formylmethanofuran dehydrogenase subunit C